MKTYNTSDFSPIHPPEDKPVNVGWYASHWKKSPLISFHEKFEPGLHFRFWSGSMWMWNELDDSHLDQDRYWFGLNKKP